MDFNSDNFDTLINKVSTITNFERAVFYLPHMNKAIEEQYDIKLKSKRQRALGLMFIELSDKILI